MNPLLLAALVGGGTGLLKYFLSDVPESERQQAFQDEIKRQRLATEKTNQQQLINSWILQPHLQQTAQESYVEQPDLFGDIVGNGVRGLALGIDAKKAGLMDSTPTKTPVVEKSVETPQLPAAINRSPSGMPVLPGALGIAQDQHPGTLFSPGEDLVPNFGYRNKADPWTFLRGRGY